MTVAEFVTRVRERIARSPDARYIPPSIKGIAGTTGCFYFRGEVTDGTVGCVMGQAVGIGITDDDAIRDYVMLMEGSREYDTSEVGDWAGYIQNRQDNGTAWGEALAAADKAYPYVAAASAADSRRDTEDYCQL
jgi:hypothetical protein